MKTIGVPLLPCSAACARSVSTTSSGAGFGAGSRANSVNSLTMRVMRCTSSSTVRVASSKYSSNAGSWRARKRRKVSTAARIGASGFLISWATRRAISRRAAIRSVDAKRLRSCVRSAIARLKASAKARISAAPRAATGFGSPCATAPASRASSTNGR